jgi:type I restriction enzyme S subunit
VAFGDVVKNINAVVRNPGAEGIDRVIAMEHLEPGELKIRRWGSISDGTTFTKRVKPGQTLFGKRRAYQRKAAYAEFDAITSGDILVFEADPRQLLPQLLPFIVQSGRFYNHALGTSAGSLSPRTNWRDLSIFEFDLPPLDEQARIADLLWAVENHRWSLVTTQNHMTNLAEIHVQNQLETGEWPAIILEELVTAGPTNGKSAPANDEKLGIPTLSISAIRDGRVNGGSAVKYIDVQPEDFESFRIKDSDFLVVRGNGNKLLTGKGGLAQAGLPQGCVFPDLMIRLRFDEARILPEFAALQWNSDFAHRRLISKAKSTNGIWKINGADIRSHTLVVPPIDLQMRAVSESKVLRRALELLHVEVQRLLSIHRSISDLIVGGVV